MKKIIFSIIAGYIFSSTAVAYNTSFLDYSPVFYFTETDSKIMHQAMINALNHARNNEKVTWKNPKTGANGYFIPSYTASRNNLSCRKLTIFNEANKVTGKSSYIFCKIDNGWKMVE